MRLLETLDDGSIRTTADLPEGTIPQYAILSHRWEDDSQEVTLEDIQTGSGQQKIGYKKIEFCSNQARSHGLSFFWVDSSCMDKGNESEVSRSIQSMFNWYRNASQCYVYLSTVSAGKGHDAEQTRGFWEQAFRQSVWFQRGWTLQELLAPASVEFFSKEGQRLGTRSSLRQEIHEITNIPLTALDGAVLSDFTVYERFSWAAHRQTKVKEDKAYSLLGIFGVSIIPIQDEGEANAFRRLKEEINKLEQCLQALHCTDPRKDKKRIEESKDGLLEESYRWILNHGDFRQWRDAQDCPLLWIKGDPGKGKTMLLCGIIDELSKRQDRTYLLSYFYCQATDNRLNSATAVLRGLLYMLILQLPALSLHVQQQLDSVGRKIFEDVNAWFNVSDIFTSLLQDRSLPATHIVVDALDECLIDQQKLLDFIARLSSTNRRVKWLVSSRNWSSIEERLNKAQIKTPLSLELNAESISAAVRGFIQHKVDSLAQEKDMDAESKGAVFNYLSSNAHDTFLWVALVSQSLGEVEPWNVLDVLHEFPPGLDALYTQMMDQVNQSRDAEVCKQILTVSVLVYRPMSVQELTCLVDLPRSVLRNSKLVARIVSHCGSFLTVRNDTIHLVHQSAKDYLLDNATATLFSDGLEDAHFQLFSRSLNAMATALHMDMYKIKHPGCSIDDVKTPSPDPLIAHRYSIVSWVDHLQDWNVRPLSKHLHKLSGMIDTFMQKTYLYWLEALSLCRGLPQGVIAMKRLDAILQTNAEWNTTSKTVRDASRFIRYFKEGLQNSPLQAYVTTFLFSPKNSAIQHHFAQDSPSWATTTTSTGDDWSPCLAVLEGHSRWVTSVAFSPHPDGRYVVSGSEDGAVMLWDIESNTLIAKLEGHQSMVLCAAFSPDNRRIMSGAVDGTIVHWDVESGNEVLNLRGHEGSVTSVSFSPNGQYSAFGGWDPTLSVRNLAAGTEIAKLNAHSGIVTSVAFSPDGRRLVSVSVGSMIQIWDTESRRIIADFALPGVAVSALAFSPNGAYLVTGCDNGPLRLYDSDAGITVAVFKECDNITTVAFSPDSQRIALGFDSKAANTCILEIATGTVTALGNSGTNVKSIAFSPDGRHVVTGSNDCLVRLWDAKSTTAAKLDRKLDHINSVAFSADYLRVATGSSDGSLTIWNANSGEILVQHKAASNPIMSVSFSPDNTLVAFASNGLIQLWNVESGPSIRVLEGEGFMDSFVMFSPDTTHILSGSRFGVMTLWDVQSGKVATQLIGQDHAVVCAAFASSGRRVVSGSTDGTVKIWDLRSANLILFRTLRSHKQSVRTVAFSPDDKLIASGSADKTTMVWDVESGSPLATFDACAGHRLRFSIDGLSLLADGAMLRLPSGEDDSRQSDHEIYLSVSGPWVMLYSQRILWLPPEYRAIRWASNGSKIGLAHRSGGFSVLSFDFSCVAWSKGRDIVQTSSNSLSSGLA